MVETLSFVRIFDEAVVSDWPHPYGDDGRFNFTGPFLVNSKVYLIATYVGGSVTDPKVVTLSSTDPTVQDNWTIHDLRPNIPVGNSGVCSAAVHGTDIHVTNVGDPEFDGDVGLYYSRYNTETDAWDVIDTQIKEASNNSPWDLDGGVDPLSICVTSTGAIVIWYAGEARKSGQNTYTRASMAVSTDDGATWSDQMFGTDEDLNNHVDAAFLGTNDRVHCLWRVSTNNSATPGLFIVTRNSDGSTTQNRVLTTADVWPCGKGDVDPSTGTCRFPFTKWGGSGYIQAYSFDSADPTSVSGPETIYTDDGDDTIASTTTLFYNGDDTWSCGACWFSGTGGDRVRRIVRATDGTWSITDATTTQYELLNQAGSERWTRGAIYQHPNGDWYWGFWSYVDHDTTTGQDLEFDLFEVFVRTDVVSERVLDMRVRGRDDQSRQPRVDTSIGNQPTSQQDSARVPAGSTYT